MIYGIWPGVVDADLVSLEPLACAAEDPVKTLAALRELQGSAGQFYVRAYRNFGAGAGAAATPARPELYAGDGRVIDLVASYRSPVPDPEGFADFVRQAVRDVAGWGGGKVQVGEELNMPAPLDGGSPGCFDAVGAGVAAALEERDRLGAPVLVGVNSAGLADPAFWGRLTTAIGPDNTRRLDYVGLDAFPDVFRPIPREKLAGAVAFLLRRFRAVTAECGVPARTPIHLTETGWPTGERRTEDAQAAVLAAVARAVAASDAGVTAVEWFGLRDGLSTGPWSVRFGILRDDYTAKPAFATVAGIIADQAGMRASQDSMIGRGLPWATVRARMPRVARSALSGTTGQVMASRQFCAILDQS